jgi:enediyne biosynthesis thioesterase
MKAYEYHHIVSFEETNLVGNVYYANYILWQGRCREMFLRDRSPGIIKELSQGLALVTVRVSCD